MRKIRMRVKMESKKGKSAVCWIYQYSKKSLWLVILLALISGAIAGSFILLALVSSSLLDVATGVKEGRLGVQIFLIVCLILLQAVLNILSSNVRIHATTKIEMQIRQGIFAAVLKKQYQHVSKTCGTVFYRRPFYGCGAGHRASCLHFQPYLQQAF
jgi:ABC-type bacteriocin/lantibiotic exporter with double-glycine peptidase domain